MRVLQPGGWVGWSGAAGNAAGAALHEGFIALPPAVGPARGRMHHGAACRLGQHRLRSPLPPPTSAGLHHPSFDASPIPYALSPKQSNQRSLEAAVEAAAAFLGSKQKPVAVAGPLLRV